MLIIGWIVVAGVVRAGNRETVGLDERDLRIQHAASRAGSGLMAMLIAKTLAENVYIVVRYRREHA